RARRLFIVPANRDSTVIQTFFISSMLFPPQCPDFFRHLLRVVFIVEILDDLDSRFPPRGSSRRLWFLPWNGRIPRERLLLRTRHVVVHIATIKGLVSPRPLLFLPPSLPGHPPLLLLDPLR
ncbi:hypothetical protein PMAYCL1PPCAC_14654, partial [Pristionchus mayeri]